MCGPKLEEEEEEEKECIACKIKCKKSIWWFKVTVFSEEETRNSTFLGRILVDTETNAELVVGCNKSPVVVSENVITDLPWIIRPLFVAVSSRSRCKSQEVELTVRSAGENDSL